MTETASIFHDLTQFVAEPRFSGLALSPAGDRLIAVRTELNQKKNAYVSALWELPCGEGDTRKPRRLTRGLEGEALAGITNEGDILFTAKRETGDDDSEQRLFLLPNGGGEARVVAKRHSGFAGLSIARESGHIALVSGVHPHAKDAEDDARIAKEREDKKFTGILHTGYPVRAWDHDLGPTVSQIFVAEPLDTEDGDAQLELRQLTHFAPHERVSGAQISSDGRFIYATLNRTVRGINAFSTVVTIDVESGSVTTLAEEDGAHHMLEAVSPAVDYLLLAREQAVSRTVPLKLEYSIYNCETGERTVTATNFSDWIGCVAITPCGKNIYFTADHEGRGGIFRLDVDKGTVELLTEGKFHYDALALAERDGSLVALQDAIDQPPLPVRLDPDTREVSRIDAAIEAPEIPGDLTEFSIEAEDGTRVRSWLCVPKNASETNPAPLLLWIHGGPFGSWNSWSWRWNPWTAVARGYAVLLPDPAISTGYGQGMIDRGWDQLGGSPFDDIMRATKAALERPEIDETKKAALGGSYGGYMANWVAGHTGDFFDCIVTHASLWNIDQFRHTTDAGQHWGAHLDDAHVAEHNPADSVGEIVAPMLVIHGDKDYRVPIGEGLRLWYELLEASGKSPEENPHRFLYFPNENHWVLTPNNAFTWYSTVLAFVDRHVKGVETDYPDLLG